VVQPRRKFHSQESPFILKDVTNDPFLLYQANLMVAETYRGFTDNTLDLEDVYIELCINDNHQQGYARTIALLGTNPLTGLQQMLGCIRIMMGDDSRPASEHLEVKRILDVEGGWDNFIFEGFNEKKAIEFGRLSIAYEFTIGALKEQGLHLRVIRNLVAGAFQLAKEQFHKDQAWAIMRDHVARAVEQSGIKLIRVPDIMFKMEQNEEFFRRYQRYWVLKKIGFYKVVPEVNPDVIIEN